ncbi:hypothetical protein OE88DRAFT_1632639, partial [Heliocybe sulcata]
SAIMSDNKPTYIYKIVPPSAAPPDPLPDVLPLSELDAKSGFIHFSTAPQILNTLRWFFKDESKVYLLRVMYDNVDKDIRWEDPKAEVCGPRGGEGMFPHLYNGPKLGKNEVESVKALDKLEGGWEEAVQKAQLEGWLVY